MQSSAGKCGWTQKISRRVKNAGLCGNGRGWFLSGKDGSGGGSECHVTSSMSLRQCTEKGKFVTIVMSHLIALSSTIPLSLITVPHCRTLPITVPHCHTLTITVPLCPTLTIIGPTLYSTCYHHPALPHTHYHYPTLTITSSTLQTTIFHC